MNSEPVVLFNPAVSSLNVGDHVIADSARAHLQPLLRGRFVIDVSTHLPLSWNYARHFRSAPWKLVLGSNLLRGRMNGLFRQWDVTPRTAPLARGSLLMGAGWWQYGDEPNRYTSSLYRFVLDRERLHSVRDHYTQEMLGRAGVDNVVVTGCPSLWSLTPAHCAAIPTRKATRVITTVTDYHREPALDRQMVETLVERYDTVAVWLQGSRDRAYLDDLGLTGKVDLLEPTLSAFDEALADVDTDYAGTRLHAGIRALQHGRRTAVVAIDNRGREKARSFRLPIVERGDVGALAGFCEGSDPAHLDLPWAEIDRWLAQVRPDSAPAPQAVT